VGAIEGDGVVGRPHRSQVPTGVAVVPLVLGPQDFGVRHLDAAGRQFALPAAGPFVGIGDEEEFTFGLRKDNGALVPTLAYQIAADRDRPLQADQEMSDCRHGR
jgi:hypothetical protein